MTETKKIIAAVALIAVVQVMAVAFVVGRVAVDEQAMGVTNLSSLHLSDSGGTATPVLMVNQTGAGKVVEFQDGGTPVWSVTNGGSTEQAGGLKMNGQVLDLDADDDTSLTADTDDQIDVEISGADDFQFTANTFTALSGSTVKANTIAETTAANGVSIDSVTVKDGGILASGTGLIDTAGITDGLVIDSDGDTTISAPTDDQIDIEISGADDFTFTANTFTAASGSTISAQTIAQTLGVENTGSLPSICTASITYTVAAGGSGTVCTVADGEIWYIHAVYANVTTNWDATGDDALVEIGDGNDTDGLLDLDDGELQTSDTEGTGAPAGWQGFMSTDTRGAYLANGHGFIYAPSGSAETIDYVIDETSGETLAAGALTVYVVYTRLQ